ncbi:MAG: response regulator [Acidobacteriota bacterium]|nr:response regulator [Acidobacteriota bacterium]
MAEVLALVDDVFFQSKLVESAKQVGVELRTCATAEALEEQLSGGTPRLVIVDLNARGNPIEALRRVQTMGSDIRLIAYLSHVQTDLAERARAAGCSEVMPRSKFTRELATILSRAKS